VVWIVLVIVTVAVAGGVTDSGLTEHTGVDVVGCVAVTWHSSFTVPANPAAGVTVIVLAEVPPGAIATGSSDVVLKSNSLVPWARAAGTKTRNRASKHDAGTYTNIVQRFRLDADPSNFTMSRFN
jgi:hypothetical protein